jgi:hypothetical protein
MVQFWMTFRRTQASNPSGIAVYSNLHVGNRTGNRSIFSAANVDKSFGYPKHWARAEIGSFCPVDKMKNKQNNKG